MFLQFMLTNCNLFIMKIFTPIDSKTINVLTGEVWISSGPKIIEISAIGSCIAFIVYDKISYRTGVAHILLPGTAPEKSNEPLKYSSNAIETIINNFTRYNYHTDKLNTFLIGGANVLKKEDDTICDMNIKSALKKCKQLELEIAYSSLGGQERRLIKFDTKSGELFMAIGNENLKKVWSRCDD